MEEEKKVKEKKHIPHPLGYVAKESSGIKKWIENIKELFTNPSSRIYALLGVVIIAVVAVTASTILPSFNTTNQQHAAIAGLQCVDAGGICTGQATTSNSVNYTVDGGPKDCGDLGDCWFPQKCTAQKGNTFCGADHQACTEDISSSCAVSNYRCTHTAGSCGYQYPAPTITMEGAHGTNSNGACYLPSDTVSGRIYWSSLDPNVYAADISTSNTFSDYYSKNQLYGTSTPFPDRFVHNTDGTAFSVKLETTYYVKTYDKSGQFSQIGSFKARACNNVGALCDITTGGTGGQAVLGQCENNCNTPIKGTPINGLSCSTGLQCCATGKDYAPSTCTLNPNPSDTPPDTIGICTPAAACQDAYGLTRATNCNLQGQVCCPKSQLANSVCLYNSECVSQCNKLNIIDQQYFFEKTNSNDCRSACNNATTANNNIQIVSQGIYNVGCTNFCSQFCSAVSLIAGGIQGLDQQQCLTECNNTNSCTSTLLSCDEAAALPHLNLTCMEQQLCLSSLKVGDAADALACSKTILDNVDPNAPEKPADLYCTQLCKSLPSAADPGIVGNSSASDVALKACVSKCTQAYNSCNVNPSIPVPACTSLQRSGKGYCSKDNTCPSGTYKVDANRYSGCSSGGGQQTACCIPDDTLNTTSQGQIQNNSSSSSSNNSSSGGPSCTNGQSTSFSITVHVPGIGQGNFDNHSPKHTSRNIKLEVVDLNNNKAIKIIPRNGTYTLNSDGTLTFSNVTLGSTLDCSGKYKVRVSVPGNLKVLSNQEVQYGQDASTNNLTATLLPGDIVDATNHQLGSDNQITIEDYNVMAACQNKTSVQLNDFGNNITVDCTNVANLLDYTDGGTQETINAAGVDEWAANYNTMIRSWVASGGQGQ